MNVIEESISAAFSSRARAQRQQSRCWVVSGTNSRGESFTMRPTDRYSADDFAAEVNGNGGDVRVVRAQR
jgi:hypothetical protein